MELGKSLPLPVRERRNVMWVLYAACTVQERSGMRPCDMKSCALSSPPSCWHSLAQCQSNKKDGNTTLDMYITLNKAIWYSLSHVSFSPLWWEMTEKLVIWVIEGGSTLLASKFPFCKWGHWYPEKSLEKTFPEGLSGWTCNSSSQVSWLVD